MPLPLYIDWLMSLLTASVTQTVYAQKAVGAVAAPTVGLHFDRELQ
jgi:S-adenosylmethionine:tRNA-ribosyltransferase-isomerase (queuine synthetase)